MGMTDDNAGNGKQMERYVLSEVIGDGSEWEPYRPAIETIPGVQATRHVVPDEGLANVSHVLSVVRAEDFAPVAKDARCDLLPAIPLDVKLNAMRSDTKAAMDEAAIRRGFSVAWGTAEGFRDVVRSIGREIRPDFDEDSLTL